SFIATRQTPRAIKLETIQTDKGKKFLVRDFRKDSPAYSELIAVADSLGTMLAYVTKERYLSQLTVLDEQGKAQLSALLDEIYPSIV
ncbi:MAG: hypothetical protein ACRDBG_17825, partial [Waterburya sp.]